MLDSGYGGRVERRRRMKGSSSTFLCPTDSGDVEWWFLPRMPYLVLYIERIVNP